MTASPCTGVCRLHDATGWCLGCGRSIGEIAAWSTLDDEGKRHVWAMLPGRLAQLPPSRPLPPAAR